MKSVNLGVQSAGDWYKVVNCGSKEVEELIHCITTETDVQFLNSYSQYILRFPKKVRVQLESLIKQRRMDIAKYKAVPEAVKEADPSCKMTDYLMKKYGKNTTCTIPQKDLTEETLGNVEHTVDVVKYNPYVRNCAK